jgi:hypothetical protein
VKVPAEIDNSGAVYPSSLTREGCQGLLVPASRTSQPRHLVAAWLATTGQDVKFKLAWAAFQPTRRPPSEAGNHQHSCATIVPLSPLKSIPATAPPFSRRSRRDISSTLTHNCLSVPFRKPNDDKAAIALLSLTTPCPLHNRAPRSDLPLSHETPITPNTRHHFVSCHRSHRTLFDIQTFRGVVSHFSGHQWPWPKLQPSRTVLLPPRLTFLP